MGPPNTGFSPLLSPYGPFYCIFRWDLSTFDHPPPEHGNVQVRIARDDEIPAAAEAWHRGLANEEGSPWANYLKSWTPTSAARWFQDAVRRQGARILIAEKDGKIVGMNGTVFEKRSGHARFLTGVVVVPEQRRQGVGSSILHRSLSEAKKEGLRSAEVETIQGITAAKYLYTKFGGHEKIVTAQA